MSVFNVEINRVIDLVQMSDIALAPEGKSISLVEIGKPFFVMELPQLQARNELLVIVKGMITLDQIKCEFDWHGKIVEIGPLSDTTVRATVRFHKYDEDVFNQTVEAQAQRQNTVETLFKKVKGIEP